jgi:uncharacterized protein (TIGR02284 family)
MTSVAKMPGLSFEKLKYLLSSLQKARIAYEQMASNLKDRQLQLTVFGLAQESRQYATELDSYVHTLGISSELEVVDIECSKAKWIENKEPVVPDEEKDILRWCAKSERSMVNVYREVLNEPFLYEGIRKMIRYQLNGIMHSFAQLKMLNASLRMH